jgi:hypothetical protein
MAEGTGHAMPKGIKRVEKGVYRTLDGRHEIRQDGKVWRLVELLGDSQVGIGEFSSRGLAVAKLAEDGKLPAEAPKGEEPAEQPQAEKPAEALKVEKSQKQPMRRPRARKPEKAGASA